MQAFWLRALVWKWASSSVGQSVCEEEKEGEREEEERGRRREGVD